jgi:hypothetical protein
MNSIALFQIVTGVVAVVPILAAVLGGIFTLMRIVRRRRAERHLSSLLAQDKQFLQELESLTRSQVDADTVNEANKLLKKRVAQLGEEDQKQLVEGLSQPSEKSRMNYIVKLVTEGERTSESLC